jgi:hypothetical protein
MESLIIILATAILLFLFYYFKNNFPTYIKEKNQASKEDIGAIAKIIENIKSAQTQQTELLEARLPSHNQHPLNITNTKRDALINYHKTLILKITATTTFRIPVRSKSTVSDVNSKLEELNQLRDDQHTALEDLKPFLTDGEFIKLANNLNVLLDSLYFHFEKIVEHYKADLLVYEKEKEKQKHTYNQELEKRIDDKHVNNNIEISNEILLLLKKIWALQDEILSFINKALLTT